MSEYLGVAVVRFLTLGIWRRWRQLVAQAAWPGGISILGAGWSHGIVVTRPHGDITSGNVLGFIIGWMFSELIRFVSAVDLWHAKWPPWVVLDVRCQRPRAPHHVLSPAELLSWPRPPSVVIWSTAVQTNCGSIAIFIRTECCIYCPSSHQKQITRR